MVSCVCRPEGRLETYHLLEPFQQCLEEDAVVHVAPPVLLRTGSLPIGRESSPTRPSTHLEASVVVANGARRCEHVLQRRIGERSFTFTTIPTSLTTIVIYIQGLRQCEESKGMRWKMGTKRAREGVQIGGLQCLVSNEEAGQCGKVLLYGSGPWAMGIKLPGTWARRVHPRNQRRYKISFSSKAEQVA